MDKKEQLIREQRTIEATRKNLMGLTGKLGVILKHLGEPILREGGSMFESSYLDDPWAEPEEIPTMDENEVVLTIGHLFDGLSRGKHLEIKYLDDRRELSVVHRGRLVYKEVAGELECYVPELEWEGEVDGLFAQAREAEQGTRKARESQAKEAGRRRQHDFLDRMRTKWGFEL